MNTNIPIQIQIMESDYSAFVTKNYSFAQSCINQKFSIMKKFILIASMFIAGIGIANAQDLKSAIKLTGSERYEEASVVFAELIKAQPNVGVNYFYYGENILLAYNADPFSASLTSVAEEARNIFKNGVAADSMSPYNYVGLGIIELFTKSDTIAADRYFTRALKGFPKKIKKYTEDQLIVSVKIATAEIWSNRPRFEKSLSSLNSVLLVKKDNPMVISAIGDVYLAKKDFTSAITNFNKALFFDQQNQELLIKVGTIYMQSRNLNAARDNFDKAAAIDSSFAPVYKAYGALYNMGGQYQLSKINFKKFLDLSGNNIPAKVSYANALFKAKDYVELIKEIEEIQKVDNSRNYLNRLAAYASYDKRPGDYPQALSYIETFFKNTTPDKVILKDYLYYGRILMKFKDDTLLVDKGIEQLLKAYEMDTTDSDLYSEIANQAYGYKRFDYAEKLIQRKLNRGDATSNDYITLGKVYYQTKRYDKADSTFSNLVAKDSTNVTAYLWLANTAASLDPELTVGLAKPKFEKVIEVAMQDSVKYATELFNSYNYLFSYYLFVKDKSKQDLDQSLNYALKMNTLDPKNTQWVSQSTKSLSSVYFYKAAYANQKKDYRLAKENYMKVLEYDPTNDDAKKQLQAINKYLSATK